MPTVLPQEVSGMTNNSLEPNVNRTNQTRNTMKRGLMVATCVRWRNWQPGNEYIKYVLMKNTQLNVQRITYKTPESKYFTTLYPKQITLNPGNSYSLPITFHPQEKKVYEDVVKCHSNNGDFEVKLVGCLPVTKVEFPESLMLPKCSLHGRTEKSFILKNTGETVISIKWLFAEPFEIKPEECMVDPGSSCSFKVIFQPKFAKLYEGMMICQFSSDEIKYKKMKVVAQGKYPHLIVSNSGFAEKMEECVDGMQTIVCFDDVAVGFSKQKNITLKNISLVEIPFKIHYPVKESAFKLDAAFDLPIKNGVIPPLSSTELPIIFHPSIVDTNYIEYFHVLPIGSLTRNVIKCVGNTIGPKMSLEPESIDFSRISLGEESTSSVELINETDVPAYYQFVIDTESSCFKLSSVSGLVKPHSSQQVSIRFQPAFAMNYYRRITCLIHNQEPLFLDLLGTCHSEFVNPAVLRMDHVKSFEIRSKQGFGGLPPDQLNELLINKAMKLAPNGRVLVPERSIDDCEINPKNSIAVYFASNPSTEECMNHEYDPPVTLDITCADFGRCTSLRTTVEKMLCITNTTRGKVCIQWTPGKEKVFTVHPSFMELPSLKSGAFKVLFNPEMQNQFYGTTLECHIFYKCMLDYRFIPDETFCPPWCFSLSCTGHTFSPESETFLAKKVILDKTDICFPSTSLQQASYKTFMIFNTGKTPLFYEFDIDHSETFCIKPNQGIIQSGHQIFVARFSPKEKKLYDQILNVRFNYTSKRSRALRFIGVCEDPEILLDNRGEIYFKQTCIGTSSTSQYSFKNMTQKILNFEWKIKRSDEKEIAIRPCSGQIMPNDTFNHMCVFSPVQAGRKIFKWNLFIWSEDAPEKLSQLQVRAFGTATSGEIMVETSYYNFGDVVVGRLRQYNIVLVNTGTCNLVYKLLVRQTVDDEEMQYPEEIAIHLSEWQIDMPAKSKQIVRATVRPSCQASYRFAIAYQLVLDEDQVKDQSLLEPKHLCHLLMNGVFPSLIVTDIRGLGSSKEISKRQLWTLFSLDCLNSYFSSDPSYQELMLSMEAHKTTDRHPSFITQAIVDFNFSAAPLHSQPSTFILQLENNGTVPAEWAFLFPDDMKLEVETWGDSGDLNDEDLHQMKVLENKLFTVEPKNLRLEPGEGTAVTLTYNHMLTGTDHLNVLLKVVDGREILNEYLHSKNRYNNSVGPLLARQ